MMILEKFWKGEVVPGERRYHPGEYSKHFQKMVECEEYMKEHLSGDDWKVFKQFSDAELAASTLSDLDNFVEGFRMGALFILDIFYDCQPPLPGRTEHEPNWGIDLYLQWEQSTLNWHKVKNTPAYRE